MVLRSVIGKDRWLQVHASLENERCELLCLWDGKLFNRAVE